LVARLARVNEQLRHGVDAHASHAGSGSERTAFNKGIQDIEAGGEGQLVHTDISLSS